MKNLKDKNKNFIVDNYIILVLLFSISAYKAIITLLELFSYGIYKKEILTNKSNLGFDLRIKIK
tara:strand:- start:69 stop:260 length:192 start_codon:yes stop_codon:yes gene_type:complete